MSSRKLVCFPFAGAGASLFRPWVSQLNDHLDVIAVQLPGREQRFLDTPFSSVEETIDSLTPEIVPLLHGAEGITLFGHSMGAMLAFELARRLNRKQGIADCRLVVSGSPSPTRPRMDEATGLGESEFLEQVERFAGYRHEALADSELRQILLPVLRADVEMHERYFPHLSTPVAIPIICVRGTDDTLVGIEEALAWQEVTTMPLNYVEVPGGHMYVVSPPPQLFSILRNGY